MVVLVRDVGLNPLSVWTILLGFVAATLLLRSPRSPDLACLLLLAAMLPAMIGGFGLLYLPSLVLAGVANREHPPHLESD